MKILLYRAGLIHGDEPDLPVVILSYFCKALMIIGIAFLVFFLTSKSYSGLSSGITEIDADQKVNVNPPKPF